jgi:hypothetical protein
MSFFGKLFGKKEPIGVGGSEFRSMIMAHAARDIELKAAKAAMEQKPEDIARAATDPVFREARINLAYATNKQLLLGSGKSIEEAEHFGKLAAEKVALMFSESA